MFRPLARRLSFAVTILSVSVLTLLPHATAAEITWAGADTFNARWSFGSSWVGGNVPQSGDSVLFTGSGVFGSNVQDEDFGGQNELAGITYAADAMSFTTTGGEGTQLSGTISNLSANDQTISFGLRFNSLDATAPGTTLNVDGAGDLILNGVNRAWSGIFVTGTGAGGVVLPSGKALWGSTVGSALSRLKIGNASSDGKLTVEGSTSANSAAATGSTGSPGELIIDGATASLQTQNSFDIGGNDRVFSYPIEAGSASLIVRNGGTVNASGSEFSVGGSATSGTGSMLVDGTNSTLTTNAAAVFLGYKADTTATISNDAVVSLGNTFGSGATIIVGGEGTTAINILSGGSLTLTGTTFLGGGQTFGPAVSGGTATVVVDGTDSSLTLSTADYTKYVGYDGTSSLTVRNSGSATLAGTVVVGESSGSSGTITLANGTLTVTSLLLGNQAGSSGTFNFGEGTADTASFAGSIGGGSGTGLVNFNSTSPQAVSNQITGSGVSIAQVGTGTTTVSGTNTFGGGVAITAGTLNAGSAGALGSSGTISFGTGTLQYSANNQTDYSGRFSAAASQPYRVDTNAQDVTFASALTSSGGTLTKLGTGTLTLTGANTYSGGTTVSAGTLSGTTTGLQGAITNNATVELSQATAGTYAGVISGSGNLVKSGAGAVTLSGNNTYGGTTTVSAGSLLINGDQSSATGSLSVLAGATLGGDGTIGGNVSVAGTHSPGTSPGLQTINGDLTYSGGASAVTWELIANTTGSAGTSYDQVALPTGNLAFSGATSLALSFDGTGSVVDWENNFWAVDRNWLLYDLSGGTTTGINNFTITTADWQDGNALALSNSSRAGATFNIALVGQDVTLNYVAPVPEPRMLGLVAIGLTGLGVAFRRRRRR